MSTIVYMGPRRTVYYMIGYNASQAVAANVTCSCSASNSFFPAGLEGQNHSGFSLHNVNAGSSTTPTIRHAAIRGLFRTGSFGSNSHTYVRCLNCEADASSLGAGLLRAMCRDLKIEPRDLES